MKITATELKTNLGKYLNAAAEEDIVITKNGKVIAHLVGPDRFAGEYTPEEYTAWLDNLERLMVAKSTSYKYDASVPGNGNGNDSSDPCWTVAFGGKTVAKLEPVKKRKRKLGFVKLGGTVSDEEQAALFEPTVEEEVLDRWENEQW